MRKSSPGQLVRHEINSNTLLNKRHLKGYAALIFFYIVSVYAYYITLSPQLPEYGIYYCRHQPQTPPLPLSSFMSLLQFPNRRSTFSERYTCYHYECRTLLTTVSPRRALRLDAFAGQLRSWCNTYEVLENKYFLPITLQFNTTNNVF